MTDPIPEPLTLEDAAREVVRFYGTDRTWSLMFRQLLGSRIDDLAAALARQATPDRAMEHDIRIVESALRHVGSIAAQASWTRIVALLGARQATPDHVVPNESPVEETDDTLRGDQCIHDGPTHTDDGFVYCQTCGATLTVLDEATPASGELDVDATAEDVRWTGGNGTSDYWRGFNDGIDKLVASLTSEATSPEAER